MVCAEPAEPAELDERKKVAINLVDARAFSYAQTPITKSVTTTPVSGIGDGAVYATLPGVTPAWVRPCMSRKGIRSPFMFTASPARPRPGEWKRPSRSKFSPSCEGSCLADSQPSVGTMGCFQLLAPVVVRDSAAGAMFGQIFSRQAVSRGHRRMTKSIQFRRRSSRKTPGIPRSGLPF